MDWLSVHGHSKETLGNLSPTTIVSEVSSADNGTLARMTMRFGVLHW